MKALTQIFIYTTALLFIASCSGDTQTAGIDRGGIRTTAVGPVSGFGSIWLNGERYDIDSAEININGSVATESDLEIGDVVTLIANVDPESNERTALTVSYSSSIRGPVAAIDNGTGSLTVLGQTAATDSSTVWSAGIQPAGTSGLSPDDLVEISGFRDSNQVLRATRIERLSTPDELILSGIISAVQTSSFTFNVGGQTVDYSSATLNGFGGAQPDTGDQVQILGSAVIAGELISTSITLVSSLVSVDDEDEGEIEGLITQFTAPDNFRIAGYQISTNAQTQFSGGIVSDLGLNIRIEAEGQFSASGVLIADKIEFRREGKAEIEATVDSVNASQNNVTVFGVVVGVNALTLIEDKTDLELRPFTLADINPGDFLKIVGNETTVGTARVIATKLERIEGEDKDKLRGIAANVAEPNFELLGVTIITDDDTEFESENSPIGANTFFAGAEGSQVEAKGSRTGNSMLAEEVELDD